MIGDLEEIVIDYLVGTKKQIKTKMKKVLLDVSLLGNFTCRRGHILGHRFLTIISEPPTNETTYRRLVRRIGVMLSYMHHRLRVEKRLNKEITSSEPSGSP